jgi:hypothetical protein
MRKWRHMLFLLKCNSSRIAFPRYFNQTNQTNHTNQTIPVPGTQFHPERVEGSLPVPQGLHSSRRLYISRQTRSTGLTKSKLQPCKPAPRPEILEKSAKARASYEIEQFSKKGETKHLRGEIEWNLVKEDGGLKILAIQYRPHKTK